MDKMGPSVKLFHHLIYVWSAIALFVCFILGMLGLTSPAWRSGSLGQGQWVDSGLIMQCHHEMGVSYHRCAPFSMGSQIAWFEVSRIFCTIAMVLLFCLVVSCGYLHVVDTKREDFMYPLGFSAFAGILGLVGATVYAAKTDHIYPEFNASLSWGWAVYIVAAILLFLISTIFIVAMRQARQKPRVRQIVPKRELIY